MIIQEIQQFITKLVRRYLQVALLPCVLAGIFVIQNIAFNHWLGIPMNGVRRIYPDTFILSLLLSIPSICLRSWGRYLYLLAVSSLTSLILLVEYLYFSYSGAFLQISALKLTGEMTAVAGTALRFAHPKLLLFFLQIVCLLTIFLWERYRKITFIVLSVPEKVLLMVMVLFGLFGGYDRLLAAENGQRYDLTNMVAKIGVVNYFLEDATKRVLASQQVTEADQTFVKDWALKRAPLVTVNPLFGAAKGRNLIFIQVESLENAVINKIIDGQEITPRLNALAREGLYFSNDHSEVGIGNTADAEFTTLNSLYPLPDSVAFLDHAQNRYTALPQLLVDHGYTTMVFHGDVPTFWNRANIYPHLGYQSWFMRDRYVAHQHVGITGLGDQDFFTQSLPAMEALPQPFMATLITLSSHTPFIIPTDLRTLTVPTNSGLSDTQTQYLESIHYTDQAIGSFIDELKKSTVYDHSLIVIFGDHGSYTGISKPLGATQSAVDGVNNTQVPLIILAPGTSLQGEKRLPASHLDVYPTVANLLGLKPPVTVLGQDLLNTSSPVSVHRKAGTGGISSIINPQTTYIAAADGVFEHGRCLTQDSTQPLPIDTCRALYTQQSDILRVSDTVVRGDLLSLLLWQP